MPGNSFLMASSKPCSRSSVDTEPFLTPRIATLPLPPSFSPMRRAATTPPCLLSVETYERYLSVEIPESKIVTGMPSRWARSTIGTRESPWDGARTIASTRRLMASSTILIWPEMSVSWAGPFQLIWTPNSAPAASAPAFTVCQNECETPLGITAMTFCDFVPVPRLQAVRPAVAVIERQSEITRIVLFIISVRKC